MNTKDWEFPTKNGRKATQQQFRTQGIVSGQEDFIKSLVESFDKIKRNKSILPGG